MKINRYINEQKFNEADKYKHTKVSIDDVLSNSKNPKELKNNFLDWIRTKKLATSHGDNTNAVKVLDTFEPNFIEYFIKCIGKNALSDDNNLFLNFLNNKSSSKVASYDRANFTDIYNLVLQGASDGTIDLNYIKDGSALIYYPDLYKNTDKNNTRLALIKLDKKAAKGGIEVESLVTEDADDGFVKTDSGLYVPSSAIKDTTVTATDETPKKTLSRQQIKNAISKREINKLSNIAQKKGIRNYSDAEDVLKDYDRLNDKDKKAVMKQLTGASDDKVSELVDKRNKKDADKGKG